MKKILLLLVLVIATNSYAQNTFEHVPLAERVETELVSGDQDCTLKYQTIFINYVPQRPIILMPSPRYVYGGRATYYDRRPRHSEPKVQLNFSLFGSSGYYGYGSSWLNPTGLYSYRRNTPKPVGYHYGVNSVYRNVNRGVHYGYLSTMFSRPPWRR